MDLNLKENLKYVPELIKLDVQKLINSDYVKNVNNSELLKILPVMYVRKDLLLANKEDVLLNQNLVLRMLTIMIVLHVSMVLD